MLAVDVAAIWLVGRRKGLLVWCGAMACASAFGLALAGFLGGCFEDHFGFFRLWAYEVFLHCVVLLLATAVLWRRSRPWLAGGVLMAAVALLAVAADAFLIEPHWLEVSHWRFASPKIHHPIRIVVVADLQTDRLGPYERSVLRQTLAEKPDLILLAGDYLQASSEKERLSGRNSTPFSARFTSPRRWACSQSRETSTRARDTTGPSGTWTSQWSMPLGRSTWATSN